MEAKSSDLQIELVQPGLAFSLLLMSVELLTLRA